MKFPILLLGSFLLAGCGGGGGSTTDSGPTALQADDMQGFWSGAVSGASLQSAASTQAVVLPDGTAWFLLVPAQGAPSGMVKAMLSVSGDTYSGTGMVYDFAAASAAPVTMTGSANAASSLVAAFTLNGASSATNASLAYSSAYTTAVTLANVSGGWQVSASAGAVHLQWNVQNDGTLTGTSTTGCTWSGAFGTRSGGTAVLNYSATETCDSVAQVYTGIAVLNSARTAGTLFVTTSNDAQGFVLAMSK